MASVELTGVRKIYEERGTSHTAVRDLDLRIADGEFVVLVGPSGCGKSTTLRMIAGLETISAGELRIGGRVMNDVPASERDIAMVFQNYALYPHMTAHDNLAFALKLRKLSRQEIDRRVHDAAAILGIEPLLGRRPKQMSGGERQRVALGRAIVRQPQVFLFDEPLSNLDAKLRVQMRREIARLHQQLRTTMIYVTHDQVEAMTLGDRIVVLHQGAMQQVDTPASLYERPRNTFVASFIGAPPMNLVEGRLHGARFEAAGFNLVMNGWPPTDGGADGRSVVLGVRPEDLLAATTAADPASTIGARVELVELLGGEALVHVRAGASEMTARMPSPVPATGSEIRLAVSTDKLHLFDRDTGARIERDPSRAGVPLVR
jgi:multiple sugar transport system ATP-binding protein